MVQWTNGWYGGLMDGWWTNGWYGGLMDGTVD